MPADFLTLPQVPEKPRPFAVTHMLDKGLPVQLTADHLNSYAQHMDFWKFGWGTAYLETGLKAKLSLLRDHGVVSCLGGTLLEIAWAQDAVEDCLSWARDVGFMAVEVSRGSVAMSRPAKGELIARATQHFTVLAETGYKDADRVMGVDEWSEEIAEDLANGAAFIVAEGRESGTVGVYDHEGEPRLDVVNAVIAAAGIERALFEAPRKSQQVWFINAYGPHVNLGNIAPDDALSLATLRRGLRADTLGLVVGSPADLLA